MILRKWLREYVIWRGKGREGRRKRGRERERERGREGGRERRM